MEAKLSEEVWNKGNTWDKYNFLRGQHDMLERLMRAPSEVEQFIEQLKEEGE